MELYLEKLDRIEWAHYIIGEKGGYSSKAKTLYQKSSLSSSDTGSCKVQVKEAKLSKLEMKEWPRGITHVAIAVTAALKCGQLMWCVQVQEEGMLSLLLYGEWCREKGPILCFLFFQFWQRGTESVCGSISRKSSRRWCIAESLTLLDKFQQRSADTVLNKHGLPLKPKVTPNKVNLEVPFNAKEFTEMDKWGNLESICNNCFVNDSPFPTGMIIIIVLTTVMKLNHTRQMTQIILTTEPQWWADTVDEISAIGIFSFLRISWWRFRQRDTQIDNLNRSRQQQALSLERLQWHVLSAGQEPL